MLDLFKKFSERIMSFFDPTEETKQTKEVKEAAVETAMEASKYLSKDIFKATKIVENTEKLLKNSEKIIKEKPKKTDISSQKKPLQNYENLYIDTVKTATNFATKANDKLQVVFNNEEKLSSKLDKSISLADETLSELYTESIKSYQTLNGTNQFIESITNKGLKDKTEKAHEIIKEGAVGILKTTNPLHLPSMIGAKVVRSAIRTGEAASEIDFQKTKFEYDINKKTKQLTNDMEEIYKEGSNHVMDMLNNTNKVLSSLFTTDVEKNHHVKSPNTPDVRASKETSRNL